MSLRTNVSENTFEIEVLKRRIARLEKLETKVKQLECKHNFKLASTTADIYISRCGEFLRGPAVNYKCWGCGKIKDRLWCDHTKKEQQALKTLDYVPKHWKTKTK